MAAHIHLSCIQHPKSAIVYNEITFSFSLQIYLKSKKNIIQTTYCDDKDNCDLYIFS